MFQSLTRAASDILQDQYGLSDVALEWKRPQEKGYGDISTVIALQLSKQLSLQPQEIAQTIVDGLSGHSDIEMVEIAGPGYVNVWLTPAALIQSLNATREACVPTPTRKKDAPVIVEYSQPNIAKPLGVHHLLTTIIGQTVSNLYRHAGYDVIAWNYIGDWGTQFGKLAVAVEKWGDSRPTSDYTVDELLALYVRFHEEVANDSTLEEQGRAASLKLEEGDPVLKEFWADVVSVTKAALGDIYDRLHVSFDLDLGESFYQDKMEKILNLGKEKGVFKEGEQGAFIVEFPEETNFPPYLVQRADGATLYSTRDIAQMRYRMDTYHPQSILILTDIAQKLHFQQLEATCTQLGWDLPGFENVLVGRMRFADKSMSTRKGNILKLEEVLDEAVKRAQEKIADHGDRVQTDSPKELAEMMGVGSVAYGILSQNRKMDIVFDWEKFLSFEGNSAPYLQYTHARACSILRKANVETIIVTIEKITTVSEKERVLVGTLLEFASVLEQARTQHMPHVLCNYLFELCQHFNAFYNDEPILTAEEPHKTLRLSLTDHTASVLKTGAELLTLRVPERM